MQHNAKRSWQARLPSVPTVMSVVGASVFTLLLTVALAAPLHHMIGQYHQTGLVSGLAVTMLATVILFCVLACWNMFTALYIVFHRLGFRSAAKAAVDLIVLRSRRVFEFVIVLIAVYAALVVAGSVLIFISQISLTTLFAPFQVFFHLPQYLSATLQLVAMVAFWVWLALTNVFFNVCLIVFFNHLVKPVQKAAVEAFPTTPVAS